MKTEFLIRNGKVTDYMKAIDAAILLHVTKKEESKNTSQMNTVEETEKEEKGEREEDKVEMEDEEQKEEEIGEVRELVVKGAAQYTIKTASIIEILRKKGFNPSLSIYTLNHQEWLEAKIDLK